MLSRKRPSSSARRTLIRPDPGASAAIGADVSLARVPMQQAQPVAVIGAPLDLGAGRRGVDMGPSAIRYAGLDQRIAELGRECADWGNVETAVAEATDEGDEHARFLPQILETCARVASLVEQAAAGSHLPLVLGGDHSIALGTLGEGERELLRRLDARVYTMSDVDRLGVERAVRESLAHVAGPGFVHVSLDMDALDPDVAPGVGTPVRGGLSYREAHLALELVPEAGLADALEVVEVNPILDRENETGRLAVELAASALGARIL